MRRTLRLLAIGWFFHVKILSMSAFDGMLAILWPLFFATVAFFMFRAGGDPAALVAASLGAAVMGIWTATSVSASSALQRQRWQGTLELVAAAPVPFGLVLLPITIATSTIGLYCVTATLLYGRLLFGIELHVVHPLLFALGIFSTVLAVGMMGFLMSVAFVRHRAAWALGAVSEYPIWLVCGFLVPVAALPDWVRPISWVLPPTWGMNAVREAALGGSPLPDALICLGLGALYVAAGALLLERLLTTAREKAALSLA